MNKTIYYKDKYKDKWQISNKREEKVKLYLAQNGIDIKPLGDEKYYAFQANDMHHIKHIFKDL